MTLLGKSSPLVERVVMQVKALTGPSPELPPVAPRTFIVGHRGSQQRAPENTLCSAQLAMDEGAHGVEVDVCVTKDGHVVLWHDRDPDDWVAFARQTGLESCAYAPYAPDLGTPQRRRISELSLEEFLSQHGYALADAEAAERGLGLPCPERVPAESLEPLAKWLADDPRVRAVILDVKLAPEESHLTREFVGDLARLQRKLPRMFKRRVQLLTPVREIFTSLRAELSRHPALANVRVSADFERPGVVQTARELGATDVSIGITSRFVWPSVREEVIEAMALRHSGALESVCVWTADREEELRQLFTLGVDMVLTDDVPLAGNLLREVQELAATPGASGA